MSSSELCWQGCNLLFPARIGISKKEEWGKGKEKKRFKWKEQIIEPLCAGYMNSAYFIHSCPKSAFCTGWLYKARSELQCMQEQTSQTEPQLHPVGQRLVLQPPSQTQDELSAPCAGLSPGNKESHSQVAGRSRVFLIFFLIPAFEL